MKITQEALDRVDYLAEKYGALTVEVILDDAQKPQSPLNELFTWDDATAAMKYRRREARSLIKVYNVHVSAPGNTFVHIPVVARNKPGQWKRVSQIVRTQSDFDKALNQAVTQVEGSMNALKALASLSGRNSKAIQPLVSQVEKILENLKALD